MDDLGNVYVAGASTGNTSHWDFTTIKCTSSGTIAASQTSLAEQSKIFALQNYPNPFSSSTTIKFNIAGNSVNDSKVKLSIVNSQGQEIAVLINSRLKRGSYTTEWNTSNRSSGIYYAQLSINNLEVVKKMTLIKK